MVFSVVLWRIRSWKLSLEHLAGGLHSKISRTLEGANVSTVYTVNLLLSYSNLFWVNGSNLSMLHTVCKVFAVCTVCTVCTLCVLQCSIDMVCMVNIYICARCNVYRIMYCAIEWVKIFH